jgi:hypothetical protein
MCPMLTAPTTTENNIEDRACGVADLTQVGRALEDAGVESGLAGSMVRSSVDAMDGIKADANKEMVVSKPIVFGQEAQISGEACPRETANLNVITEEVMAGIDAPGMVGNREVVEMDGVECQKEAQLNGEGLQHETAGLNIVMEETDASDMAGTQEMDMVNDVEYREDAQMSEEVCPQEIISLSISNATAEMQTRKPDTEVAGVEVAGVEVAGVEVAGAEVAGAEVAGAEVAGAEVVIPPMFIDLPEGDYDGDVVSPQQRAIWNHCRSPSVLVYKRRMQEPVGLRIVKMRGLGVEVDAAMDVTTKEVVCATEVAGVEVAGVEVAGVEVAGVEVAGVEVAGVEVAGAKVADAEVADAEVADAEVADAEVAGAEVAGAKVAGAKVAGAKVAGAKVADAEVADAEVADAEVAGAEVADAEVAKPRVQEPVGLRIVLPFLYDGVHHRASTANGHGARFFVQGSAAPLLGLAAVSPSTAFVNIETQEPWCGISKYFLSLIFARGAKVEAFAYSSFFGEGELLVAVKLQPEIDLFMILLVDLKKSSILSMASCRQLFDARSSLQLGSPDYHVVASNLLPHQKLNVELSLSDSDICFCIGHVEIVWDDCQCQSLETFMKRRPHLAWHEKVVAALTGRVDAFPGLDPCLGMDVDAAMDVTTKEVVCATVSDADTMADDTMADDTLLDSADPLFELDSIAGWCKSQLQEHEVPHAANAVEVRYSSFSSYFQEGMLRVR